MELKDKLQQINDLGAKLLGQRQELQKSLEAINNDLLRLEGQAVLVMELDPSLRPQAPQPINPQAAAPEAPAASPEQQA